MDAGFRYLYVGSSPALLKEVVELLGWQARMRYIIAAYNVVQALTLADEIHPQVILIGMDAPLSWCVDLLPRWKELLPESDILIFIPSEINGQRFLMGDHFTSFTR
jgi:hypothetical protein